MFLTPRASRVDRIKSLRAGVDAYLTKPFESEELVASIQNILARVRLIYRRVAGSGVSPLPATAASSAGVEADPALPEPRAVESTSNDRWGLSELTETEGRIAQLVARSLTNKEIASALGISYRTVETHISHILAKKNLANRVELALLVAHESQVRRTST